MEKIIDPQNEMYGVKVNTYHFDNKKLLKDKYVLKQKSSKCCN